MPHSKPYKLITVSTTPDRASRMVRRLAEDVRDRYMIIHCVNVSSMSMSMSMSLVCAAVHDADDEGEATAGLTMWVDTEIEEVESLVTLYRPDILFCASTWSPDQSAEIKRIARGIVPGLRCYVIPQRTQVEKESVATIEHVKAQLPMIIEDNLGLQD
ncbi:hypothetical protein G647_00956 [Cladophialophora carrionii CBS 160.54]|uniref:Flavodoxin-like domain-containing protein n=1 Tax=Cladophialophora carrionii CBS 160.54 TaxID=1279043 RepID=V9DRD1_9EURO|nr:uncharacterized protein G647_00956 [Cladophialophora carrionii CBS 160.54]ETI28507.1 hypothetical protein G647_00956 [Cladophialophora carrionii CBS 160.54]